MRRVVWFSCGAASAVAAKLACDAYGDGCEVVYCDTMATEHPDNARFFVDVQRWIGREITKIRSSRYATIDEVFERVRYMSGVKGARCTAELKKLPRLEFERPDDVHLFGYTSDERKRAADFEDQNPALIVEWILIDHGVTKAACHQLLRDAGIAQPAMYGLGFEHNNCIGCVKSSSAGYWNKVRRLFPEVFARRAAQGRLLGWKPVILREERDPETGKRHNVRCSLDDLPPDAEAPDDDIDCGPVCQMPVAP